MATPEQFAQNMEKIAATVERRAPAIQRKVAAAVLQAVVVGTPVDTGRARSNWLVGIGAARTEVRDSLAGAQKGKHAGGGVTSNVVQEGNGLIEGAQDGTEIHLTNNLPYIVALNSGTSAQAPAGFVETAIQAAVAAIQNEQVTR